jgi:cell fate regulator YaaT (PSP1 superfamily)
MTKQAIIERTVKIINQLPESKAEEISDFADFVIKRYEEQELTEGIQNIVSDGQAFEFLRKEEEIYSEKDLKIIFGE